MDFWANLYFPYPRWKKNEKELRKKLATTAFIEMKHKKDIIRLWIDRNHVPYKVEIRFDKMFCGYMDVDQFMEKFRAMIHDD